MLTLLALACTSPDPGDSAAAPGGALVDGAAWVLDLDHEDPLADHRPEGATCSMADIDQEYGGVEIQTGACTYAQLVQPLLGDLAVGDDLRVVAWHQDLVADAPAQAHLALLVGGSLLWERHATVPGAAEAWDEHQASPLSAPAGTDVILHLHNHGANTWTLQSVDRDE